MAAKNHLGLVVHVVEDVAVVVAVAVEVVGELR
jgi:hypothetical protein